MLGANSVPTKVDIGASSFQEASTTRAAPSGVDTKKPPAQAASKMAKKTLMA